MLPSSNVIVRTSQFGAHASKTMHWLATWPSSLIVALPHAMPVVGFAPISTNVAWYFCVEADAGPASTSITASDANANASLSSFIVVLPLCPGFASRWAMLDPPSSPPNAAAPAPAQAERADRDTL